MAAVSIQLTPAPSASRMAAMESLSSWSPQANSQPEPPMAQAPKPIGVMNRSEFPSRFVFMVSPPLLRMDVSFQTLQGDNGHSWLGAALLEDGPPESGRFGNLPPSGGVRPRQPEKLEKRGQTCDRGSEGMRGSVPPPVLPWRRPITRESPNGGTGSAAKRFLPLPGR